MIYDCVWICAYIYYGKLSVTMGSEYEREQKLTAFKSYATKIALSVQFVF